MKAPPKLATPEALPAYSEMNNLWQNKYSQVLIIRSPYEQQRLSLPTAPAAAGVNVQDLQAHEAPWLKRSEPIRRTL